MNDKDNRIIQGTEIPNLENTVNGASAPDAQPSQSYTQPSQTGAFPEVDTSKLNQSLYTFLKIRATPDKVTQSGGDFYLPTIDCIKENTIETIVKSLGHSFFKLENLSYRNIGGKYYFIGDLKLNTQIPFDSLKNGIASLMGKDMVDYFLEEYGDRIGIVDQTKPFDISKPEIQEYLPGILPLKELSTKVFVMKNPYLLLLTLDLDERKNAALFFNYACDKGWSPFPSPLFTSNRAIPIKEYAFSESDIANITTHPNIITFEQLLEVGKANKIKGLAACGDRLKKFNELLKGIRY